MPTFESAEFRSALGRFATGVTIVTTLDPAGTPVGVTASSYNSVSLDPPLVLWSLAKGAKSMAAFSKAGGFIIHVLGIEQEPLASRFASSGTDKFAGVEFAAGHMGMPLLGGCAAHFECETAYQYEGGDHVIFVGKVVRFEKSDYAPLIFHGGKFAEARHRIARASPTTGDANRAGYANNFLPHLLSRAHAQIAYPLRQEYARLDMSNADYYTLGLLSLIGQGTTEDLIHRLDYTGHAPTAESLTALQARGWVDCGDNAQWQLTAEGRKTLVSLLMRSRALEESLLGDFDPQQVEQAKAFLRLLIERSSSGLPNLPI